MAIKFSHYSVLRRSSTIDSLAVFLYTIIGTNIPRRIYNGVTIKTEVSVNLYVKNQNIDSIAEKIKGLIVTLNSNAAASANKLSPSKNPLKNLNPSAKYAIIELKEEGNKNAVQLF